MSNNPISPKAKKGAMLLLLISLILQGSILVNSSNETLQAAETETKSVNAQNIVSNLSMDGDLSSPLWALTSPVNTQTMGRSDNVATFGVLWDSNYLYVAAKVLDSNLVADSPSAWEDDSIGIYIDAGENDLVYLKAITSPGIVERNNRITGVLAGLKQISDGYTVSLAIPWSTIGTLPEAGNQIGINISVNDDDDGADKDSELVWSGAGNPLETKEFGICNLLGVSLGLPLPKSPVNLVLSTEYPADVVLNWNDSSNNEDGFKIERSTTGRNFSQIATVPANVTTYKDLNLSANIRYYYRVRSYHSAGNSPYSDTVGIVLPPPAPPVTISLGAGWNLISIPRRPRNPSIEYVLANIREELGSVYSWERALGKYQSYTPGSSSNDLNVLEVGKGYWVHMKSPATLVVAGLVVKQDIDLAAGWNLVGFSGARELSVAQALTSVSQSVTAVYTFNNTTGQYESFSPDAASSLLTMGPGRGYWMYISEASAWSLP
jgi:hypothetical protein